MRSIFTAMSNLRPRWRRLIIMMMDILMVMVSIPLSLLLSNSLLSFSPLSAPSVAAWVAIGLASHVLFRASGLYRMMWRFASTPDFFNILRNCVALSVGLYAAALALRTYTPVTGLNERQFLVFFFVTFAFISAPRLVYRYLREGKAWGDRGNARARAAGKRALFLGSLEEADLLINYARSNVGGPLRLLGIVTNDRAAAIGSNIHGIAIVSDQKHARACLEEYVKDTDGLDVVIFGQGAERVFADFPELVRIARQGGAAVEQFSGLSHLTRGGKLTLEKVEMETILRRATVAPDTERLSRYIGGKRVLVTGGAGSIGRMLVRRALELDAEAVLVADISEFNIFRLQSSFDQEKDRARLSMRILDIGDRRRFAAAVRHFRPDIIFHAAALKHVPLLEENWEAAIKTNVFGTLNCAAVAVECGVPQFVLISSDKAADPTSILGLTKLMAEQVASGMNVRATAAAPLRERGTLPTNLTAVRFGNVFGSDGSVATVFQRQIDSGGPVTVTDAAMTRYLMTIGEAVNLVVMAAAVSADTADSVDHRVYMLDMGEPVSILTVAETMIRLAGKQPYIDIPIVMVGRRPGEKLHEQLYAPGEETVEVGVPSIFGLNRPTPSWAEIEAALEALRAAADRGDRAACWAIMKDICDPATLSARRLRAANDMKELRGAASIAAPTVAVRVVATTGEGNDKGMAKAKTAAATGARGGNGRLH